MPAACRAGRSRPCCRSASRCSRPKGCRRSSSGSPPSRVTPRPFPATGNRCSDRLRRVRAPDVRGPDRLHADRLSRGLQPGRRWAVVRSRRHRARLLPREPPDRHAGAGVRHPVERAPACDPVLHVHGGDPGALRPGRGYAGGCGAAVRPGERRAILRGHPGGGDPRRHHRHGRRLGDRHGADRPADHDALRLRHATRDRGHRGLGHHHPDHPAVARPGGAGRPARPLGRRHVRGRSGAEPRPGAAVQRLRVRAQHRGPGQVPALPPEARTLQGWPLLRKCLWGMVPSLVLIVLVLGTILMGLATPTEGGAMGAVAPWCWRPCTGASPGR